MKLINSRSNALYKSLAKLKDSPRERRVEKSALLDGAHLISAYVEHIGAPRAVAVADTAQQDPAIRALLARTAALEPIVLADGLFRELSPVTTPTGILAVVEIPAPKAVPVRPLRQAICPPSFLTRLCTIDRPRPWWAPSLVLFTGENR